jgi:hypothetical protein
MDVFFHQAGIGKEIGELIARYVLGGGRHIQIAAIGRQPARKRRVSPKMSATPAPCMSDGLKKPGKQTVKQAIKSIISGREPGLPKAYFE